MQTREKRKNVNMLYLKILKRNNKMIFTLLRMQKVILYLKNRSVKKKKRKKTVRQPKC